MSIREFKGVAVIGIAVLLSAAFTAARQDPATASAPCVIDVVAKRVTSQRATLDVTDRARVRLRVTSGDGVHGLHIRKFDVNKLVPGGGDAVTIDFVASAPGTYEILCPEECGDRHDVMTGTQVVNVTARA